MHPVNTAQPTARHPALALVALGLAALIGSVFFGRFAPAATVVRETAGPAAAAALVLLASLAAGSFALRIGRWAFGRFADQPNPAIDDASTAETILIGIPTLGSAVGVIAWAALPLRGSILLLTLAAAAFGCVVAWRKASAGPRERFGAGSVLSAILLAPPILLAIVQAIIPVNSPDELAYKLAVPQAYLQFGRMLELPLNSDSYFPFALHLTDMVSLAISGGIAAKLVRLAAYILTLMAVHRFARRTMPHPIVAVAVLAWTPALMIIAGWCWEEWALIGLLLVSFDRLQRWLDDGGASNAAVCSVALGSALASKYTALPWLLVFSAVAIYRLARGTFPRTPRVRFAGVTLLLLAAFGGLFYVRNLIWTGSPIAPLLLPNSPAIENFRSGERFGGWIEAARGYDVFHPEFVDESLGIVLPLLVLLSIAVLLRRDRTMNDLFAVGALQMLILLSIGPGSRLMLTGLFPLALCGAAVMSETWDRVRAPLRVLLGAACVLALSGQLVLVLFTLESYEFLPYLAGKENARTYLTRTRTFMAPYAWIETNTPPSAVILLLGENRSYYLPRRGLAAGNLDGPRIADYLGKGRTSADLHLALRRDGVTHILIHTPWYRVATAGTARLTMLEKEYVLEVPPETHRLLREVLATRAALRYRDGEYLIYEFVR